MESIFVFVIMDGSGPGDNPLSVSFVRSLTVQQLWCLLWTVLAVLHEFSTDPWEGSGIPNQSTAAHSTAAPSTAAPATPAGVPPPVPTPLAPFVCSYRCVYCSAWCSRGKPGRRHHRCRSHHDY